MPRLFYKLATGLAALFLGYVGVGYVLYDGLSAIGSACEQNGRNRPDRFTCVTDCDAWQTFDFDAYSMPYEAVHFDSRDDLRLSGWFVSSTPEAAAIVIVHGYQVCKYHHHPLAQAGALYRSGFNVLLFDQRDCGDSEQEDGRSAYGSEEYLDALGAFDYLQTRGFSPDRIGMHGSSLGGAITLTAFAQEPRLKAIFLDSPLTDPRGAFTQYTGLPDVLFPGVEWAARWVAGDELLRYDPLDGIRRAAGRGLSVVHGGGDRIVEPSHTELLLHVASENGVSVEAWKPPGVGHVEALAGHPRQYQRRMRAFFARHLGRTVHL